MGTLLFSGPTTWHCDLMCSKVPFGFCIPSQGTNPQGCASLLCVSLLSRHGRGAGVTHPLSSSHLTLSSLESPLYCDSQGRVLTMDKSVQRLKELRGRWGHVKLRLGFSPCRGRRGGCVTRGWSDKALAASVPFGFTGVTGASSRCRWGTVLARKWGGGSVLSQSGLFS